MKAFHRDRASTRAILTFARDRDGATAVVFALTLFPAVLVLGVGIDYARATTERNTLQAGTDAAALAGIQALQKGQTVSQATPLIQQVLASNDSNAAAYVKTINLSADGTTLCVTSVSAVPTTIMAVGGFTSVAVGATACSAMRLDTFEIAFAIDNSGSMNNSAANGKTKIQSAMDAANGMINALSPSNGSTNVAASYSLVPFSTAVNVGPQYSSASWMDTQAQSSIHWQNYLRPTNATLPASRFAMFTGMGTAWGGCVEERPSPYTTSDTAATTGDTLFVPFLAPDETDNNKYVSKYGDKANALTINNYIKDTGGTCVSGDIYDQWDQQYGAGDGQTKLCKYMKTESSDYTGKTNLPSGGPASANAGCQSKAILPLNATASTVTTAVNAMTAAGDTTLMAGFMWAWRTISPNGPFNAGGNTSPSSGQQAPKAYGYVNPATNAANHKIIILLTDGMNHWYGMAGDNGATYAQGDPNGSTYGAFGFFGNNRLGNTTSSNARSLMDSATLQACTNAKNATDNSGAAQPVEIYTVGFLATDGIDDAGQTLLKNCATDASHSFIAADGDALVQVFQQIAQQIMEPRIAR